MHVTNAHASNHRCTKRSHQREREYGSVRLRDICADEGKGFVGEIYDVPI